LLKLKIEKKKKLNNEDKEIIGEAVDMSKLDLYAP
jgi:hypothetical protein